MPPAPIRRPVTIALWLVLSTACLVFSPVILGLAAIASAVTQRPQALILARLIVAYFIRELAGLFACGALWLASGFGIRMRSKRVQTLHWRLLRWLVHDLAGLALKLVDVDVQPEASEEATHALQTERPLLIFSRHAGPGDTLLIIDELMYRFDRRPSVVFKEALAFDPCIDLIGHRLPHAVLDTEDREECEAEVQKISSQLGPRGALLLFPEGGNFTPERRRTAISALRRKGKRRAAARAEQMSNVMPPRPSGALAALHGNPGADVVFAAHTGLGRATYPREMWREMPIGKTLHTRKWLVPSTDVPTDEEQQITWLFDRWKQIDDWVEQKGTER